MSEQAIILLIGELATLAGALSYYIKGKSDARIKQLEIQLERTKGGREKTNSDERQTDKLIASSNNLLVMLAKEQDARAKVEETNESNYQTLKNVFDRDVFELRAHIDTSINKLQVSFNEAMQNAMATLQKQAAAHDVYRTMKAAFPVAPEHDCNWKQYTLHFNHAAKIRILKAPLHLNDEVVGFVASGDTVYGIDAMHRPEVSGWMQVRSIEMPESAGWVELWNVRVESVTTVSITPAAGD